MSAPANAAEPRKAGLPIRSWPDGIEVRSYHATELVDPGPRRALPA